MRATASPEVSKFVNSETSTVPFPSFAQNLPWRLPVDSTSPESSTFGMDGSIR
jgi:hypothetical protein